MPHHFFVNCSFNTLFKMNKYIQLSNVFSKYDYGQYLI
jgi:hypothetical protein